MAFKDYLIEKEFISKEQLEEGKFIKDVPDNIVKKLMKDHLESIISKVEDSSANDEDEFGGQISRLKVQEYLEEYLKNLITYGPMTKVDKKGNRHYKETTAFWVVEMMKEIGLDTNKPKNIEDFEKKLTVISGKLLGKIK